MYPIIGAFFSIEMGFEKVHNIIDNLDDIVAGHNHTSISPVLYQGGVFVKGGYINKLCFLRTGIS